jgi:predicted PurR-regulated permease PerM
MSLLIVAAVVGCSLSIFYLYFRLWRRSRVLEQQLQNHQQRMKQTITEIHNRPLQMLAFLMREIQIHEMEQQDLITHLHDVYQDVRSGVQNLQDEETITTQN